MDTQQSEAAAMPTETEMAPPVLQVGSRRPAYPWRAQARAATAVVAGRASGALARRLRRGAGTSLPGLVARWVDPTIAGYLAAQLRHGSVVVTGTNGKTTTCGLLAYVLRAGGLRVWRNREGANLARGITAALLIRARPTGRLRWDGNAAVIFEVDEAAFPQVVAEVQPRAIVVTNLFRDQLDRYGEVDTVAERWRDTLKGVSPDTRLVLNADDPAVAALADGEPTRHVIYFGVEEAPSDARTTPAPLSAEVIDTRTCPRCRAPLSYTLRFYSHVGHWACPACGYTRPRPAVFARAVVHDGPDAMRFQLVTPSGARDVRIALPGLYNVYNALAAAAAGVTTGYDTADTSAALARFMPAFGRAERIAVDGREVRLLLAKNPTGLNEVLRALAAAGAHAHLLMLLNDAAADGEDVSWIWDAGLEQVAAMEPASLTVSGRRAYDLALRLKYAGAPVAAIEPDVPRALDEALSRTPPGERLYVVPTYTAMLAVRAELERRGYAPHYWEQRDG
ncbi:MAG: MurT ligase domain-containing protein [Ktedonobacterales bacterium]